MEKKPQQQVVREVIDDVLEKQGVKEESRAPCCLLSLLLLGRDQLCEVPSKQVRVKEKSFFEWEGRRALQTFATTCSSQEEQA